MAELTDTELREHVRARYSNAALRMADRDATAGCGCGCETAEADTACCTDAPADDAGVFGADLYADADTDGATDGAVAASLGCGVPTAVADLHEGETVLDLGSGAGADVLISARRVGATGRAIGLDMTAVMLALGRAVAAEAGRRLVHPGRLVVARGGDRRAAAAQVLERRARHPQQEQVEDGKEAELERHRDRVEGHGPYSSSKVTRAVPSSIVSPGRSD